MLLISKDRQIITWFCLDLINISIEGPKQQEACPEWENSIIKISKRGSETPEEMPGERIVYRETLIAVTDNQIYPPEPLIDFPESLIGWPEHLINSSGNQIILPETRIAIPENRMVTPKGRIIMTKERIGTPGDRIGEPNDGMITPSDRTGKSNDGMIKPLGRTGMQNDGIVMKNDRIANPEKEICVAHAGIVSSKPYLYKVALLINSIYKLLKLHL